MNRHVTVLVVLVLALSALACSTRREASARPVVAQAAGQEEPPPPEDPSDVHLEGDHVTIDERIRFALNSDEILGESSTILDHLAQFLNNHVAEVPALQVIGHTDTQGNARSNQDLSERRAAAVVRALQERGVQQRLEPLGRGQTQLLCQETTEDCHRQNRRVEFLVVQ
ncbi:MAG: OmpA family protein [Sandaracinaceae bacterium]|nr:OmpA family protein [Sandaracinaceae bacterium]